LKIPQAAIKLLLERHPVGRLATLGAAGYFRDLDGNKLNALQMG
jgi:hypothetical protein